jgi:hypothetical protein
MIVIEGVFAAFSSASFCGSSASSRSRIEPVEIGGIQLG